MSIVKILSAVLFVFIGPLALAEEPHTTLSISTVTSNGQALSEVRVSLTGNSSKQMFVGMSNTEGEFEIEVPYDTYEVELALGGFIKRHERISVDESHVSYRLGLDLALPHGTLPIDLYGEVGQAWAGKSGLWVRLVAFFSSDFLEADVDRRGKFKLTRLSPGKYLLILLQNEMVLSTKLVDKGLGVTEIKIQ